MDEQARNRSTVPYTRLAAGQLGRICDTWAANVLVSRRVLCLLVVCGPLLVEIGQGLLGKHLLLALAFVD
jgi:hypothetical protein